MKKNAMAAPMQHVITAAFLVGSALSWAGENSPEAVVQRASATHGGTLLSVDFNTPNAWPDALSADTAPLIKTRVSQGDCGTVDIAGSTQPSGAWLLSAEPPTGQKSWSAVGCSGKLAVQNAEADLRKLTLSFSLSASVARSVMVQIASFDAAGKPTGDLETLVHPAAPDFFQRFAIDLSSMRPGAGGKFEPTAPFVQLTFTIADEGVPNSKVELRVDNVHYASPAFYVSPQGSDDNDGRTESTAFATPQKAVDAAGPGDIILLMNGTYQPVSGRLASFQRGGTPPAWIIIKNYPGHQPQLSAVTIWNGVEIGRSKSKSGNGLNDLPVLCYIEVRGLHIRGNGDTVWTSHPETIGLVNPISNSNGISVDGRYEVRKPHHIRLADNVVEFCAGGGISAISSDWITIENNISRNNCWPMIYAGSGISVFMSSNFDPVPNTYKTLVRNNITSGNRCFVKWKEIGKISDGNGIIIDTNFDEKLNQNYLARTLIQNNLCFNNGGAGINVCVSRHVDIINNTACFNGVSPELRWGQIFGRGGNDVRVINNIMISDDNQSVNTFGPNTTDKENVNVERANNLYFGGNVLPIMGENDVVADPKFVSPSTDEKVADFHLRTDSPALKSGRWEAFGPVVDFDGKPRPARIPPDKGAYQK